MESLLAQPRRKQIISKNPQGKNDSEMWQDYGKKLMQKSGWNDGDGLGSDLQGDREHLAMKFKNDNRGLGCTIQYEQNWLAHGDDFNALLATLNAEHNKPKQNSKEEDSDASSPDEMNHSQPVGLEEKSKSAKRRIHYGKFTRGKDLSLRSTDEISKVFGGKMPSHKIGKTEDNDEASLSIAPKEDKITGLQSFQSKESVQDYFAKKMALKKASTGIATPTTPDSGDDVPDISSKKKHKKQTNSDADLDVSGMMIKTEEQPAEKRSKKVRRETSTLEHLPVPDAIVDVAVEEAHVESKEERRLRKQARRLKREAAETNDTFANPSNSSTEETVLSKKEEVSEVLTTTSAEGDIAVTTSTTTVTTIRQSLPPPSFIMSSVRHHLLGVGPEARAAMFPGSNIFDIVGYGDELFFQ